MLQSRDDLLGHDLLTGGVKANPIVSILEREVQRSVVGLHDTARVTPGQMHVDDDALGVLGRNQLLEIFGALDFEENLFGHLTM